jgi:hypothetical protein
VREVAHGYSLEVQITYSFQTFNKKLRGYRNHLFLIISEQPGIKIIHCMDLQVTEIEEKRNMLRYRKRRKRTRGGLGVGGGKSG